MIACFSFSSLVFVADESSGLLCFGYDLKGTSSWDNLINASYLLVVSFLSFGPDLNASTLMMGELLSNPFSTRLAFGI